MAALMPRARVVATVLVAATALAACAGAQDDEATAVAEQLVAAVDGGRGDEACGLLAPAARSELESSSGKPCAQAVLEEKVGPAGTSPRVEVFQTMAQVRFADDAVFLSRFDGAWLVVGAACTPQAARPYDCSISVG
jgi:hypothetical protein